MFTLLKKYMLSNKKKITQYILIISFAIAISLISNSFFIYMKKNIEDSSAKKYGRYEIAFNQISKETLEDLKKDNRVEILGNEYVIGNSLLNNKNIVLISQDDNFYKLSNYLKDLTKGKFPNNKLEIAVDDEFANKNNFYLNDNLRINYKLTNSDSDEVLEARIVGIIKNDAITYDLNIVIVPHNYINSLNHQVKIDKTLVKLKDFKSIDDIINDYSNNEDDNFFVNYDFISTEKTIEILDRMSFVITSLIIVIFFVTMSLIMSGFINNILSELSTLLAIGYKKRFIIALIALILMTISVLSIIPGLIIYNLMVSLLDVFNIEIINLTLNKQITEILLSVMILVVLLALKYAIRLKKMNILEFGNIHFKKRKKRKTRKIFSEREYVKISLRTNLTKSVTIILISTITFVFLGFVTNQYTMLYKKGYDYVKDYIPEDIAIETNNIGKSNEERKVATFSDATLNSLVRNRKIRKVYPSLVYYGSLYIESTKDRINLLRNSSSLDEYQPTDIKGKEYIFQGVTIYGIDELFEGSAQNNVAILLKSTADALNIRVGEKIFLQDNRSLDDFTEFTVIDIKEKFPFRMQNLRATDIAVKSFDLMQMLNVKGYNKFDISLVNSNDNITKNEIRNIDEVKKIGYVLDYDEEVRYREEKRKNELAVQVGIIVSLLIITIILNANIISENIVSKLNDYKLLFTIGFNKKTIINIATRENMFYSKVTSIWVSSTLIILPLISSDEIYSLNLKTFLSIVGLAIIILLTSYLAIQLNIRINLKGLSNE